jgi:hypothetical protein
MSWTNLLVRDDPHRVPVHGGVAEDKAGIPRAEAAVIQAPERVAGCCSAIDTFDQGHVEAHTRRLVAKLEALGHTVILTPSTSSPDGAPVASSPSEVEGYLPPRPRMCLLASFTSTR